MLTGHDMEVELATEMAVIKTSWKKMTATAVKKFASKLPGLA